MGHIVGEGRHHSEITCKISSKDPKSCLSLRRTHQSGRRLRTHDHIEKLERRRGHPREG